MSFTFGSANPALTRAIKKVARGDTNNVSFTRHSLEEMDDDGFDHSDVLDCLRNGTAYGPEIKGNQWRANVIHRGLHIRVVAGGADFPDSDWSTLARVKVITVMRT